MMEKKVFGIDIWNWILIFILILMEKLRLLTFAHALVINVIVIGLEYILEELQKIRRLLECLNAPPFHINCRHQIIKNEEE